MTAGLFLVGGLQALQAAALAAALPFSIVLLLMCWASVRSLQKDVRRQGGLAFRARLERVTHQVKDEVVSDFSQYPELEEFVDGRSDYRLSRIRGILNRSPVIVRKQRVPKHGRAVGAPVGYRLYSGRPSGRHDPVAEVVASDGQQPILTPPASLIPRTRAGR